MKIWKSRNVKAYFIIMTTCFYQTIIDFSGRDIKQDFNNIKLNPIQ